MIQFKTLEEEIIGNIDVYKESNSFIYSAFSNITFENVLPNPAILLGAGALKTAPLSNTIDFAFQDITLVFQKILIDYKYLLFFQ